MLFCGLDVEIDQIGIFSIFPLILFQPADGSLDFSLYSAYFSIEYSFLDNLLFHPNDSKYQCRTEKKMPDHLHRKYLDKKDTH